jgi:hypothetical protein
MKKNTMLVARVKKGISPGGRPYTATAYPGGKAHVKMESPSGNTTYSKASNMKTIRRGGAYPSGYTPDTRLQELKKPASPVKKPKTPKHLT